MLLIIEYLASIKLKIILIISPKHETCQILIYKVNLRLVKYIFMIFVPERMPVTLHTLS
jgi:hypothetical protein